MQNTQILDLTALGEQGLSAKNLSLAVIRTEFNRHLVDGLEWGAKQAFISLGGDVTTHYRSIIVPGVVELPLACKAAFEQTSIDAIVALGVVIRGETSHFDYVCQMCSQGIMQVMLQCDKPIAFGVLTTNNSQQAQDRCQKNDLNKGIEAMVATLKMCQLNYEIGNSK